MPAWPGQLAWLACLYLPALGLLVAAAILAQVLGIPAGQFTRDMAAIAEVHPLKGALSNVGILLWTGAAAISLFSGATLWRRGDNGMARFLIASGCLTFCWASPVGSAILPARPSRGWWDGESQ